MRTLRARRTDLRKAIERVPVLGPRALSMFRAGRRLWVERRTKPEPKPERFLALYQERNNIADLERIVDPVQKLHVDFALSTVPRGRYACGRIKSYVDVSGKSYLDVGCAYGGFLVAFSEAGAKRVVGIDLNPQLLDYARALLADYRVQAEVREIDVLAADRSPELGRFDVITCNDVIEHVLDPRAALARLAALMTDDGLLYMEIPNRWSAAFVLSDGHFKIFGITALPKKKADQYFGEVKSAKYFGKNKPSLMHDVTYESLPFYLNNFTKLGLTWRVISSTPADLPSYLEKISGTFDECERALSGGVSDASAETQATIDLHVRRIARAFRRGHERYRSLSSTDRRAAEKLGKRLFLMFGCDFWTILVEKRKSAPMRTMNWTSNIVS